MFSHQSKQNHLVQFLQELEPGSEVKITNTHISAVIGIVKSQKGIWGLAKCVFTEHTAAQGRRERRWAWQPPCHVGGSNAQG